MRYKLAIFDLDGTLLNTLEDLTDSLNHTLSSYGYPNRTIEEVQTFIGNGIHKLIEQSLPPNTPHSEIEKVFQGFLTYYGEHCMDKTTPYNDIIELLKTLKKAGCHLAVVSNKADYAVQKLCKHYFPGLLDIAFGEQQGIPKKPAPDLVKKVLTTFHVDNSETVYIGDSEVDILTASNAEMDGILVSWGYRKTDFLKSQGAKTVVTAPKEIAKIILI